MLKTWKSYVILGKEGDNMTFPKEISHFVRNLPYTVSETGMTDSTVYLFDDYVLKVEKTHTESNHEHKMFQFLQGKFNVPKIIQFHQEKGFNYLLMERISGLMAFDKEIMNDPINMIHLLTNTLSGLWSVSQIECPCNRLDMKLKQAKYLVEHNLVNTDDFDPDIVGDLKNPKEILHYLQNNKPDEELVVTHGDFCLPNVLYKDNELIGIIDLGRGGLADKWQDISLCLRSMRYNLGEEYKREYFDYFLECLGIEFDRVKFQYYLLLDELF